MLRYARPSCLSRALVLAALAACCALGSGCGGTGESATLVAVGASLRDVLPEILTRFAQTPGATPIVATYGGSGTLRAQLEAGAPIDAVVFAGAGPVDAGIASGLLLPKTRRVIATNQLVLVSARAQPGLRFATLPALPENARIAVGAPDEAPVGAYARELLRSLHLWDALQERIVFGGHVAAVLAYVQRGEVTAGIVYRTDALARSELYVLDAAPDLGPDAGPESPQIVAAVVAGARHEANARGFVAFLVSPEAARIFEQHGFGVFDAREAEPRGS